MPNAAMCILLKIEFIDIFSLSMMDISQGSNLLVNSVGFNAFLRSNVLKVATRSPKVIQNRFTIDEAKLILEDSDLVVAVDTESIHQSIHTSIPTGKVRDGKGMEGKGRDGRLACLQSYVRTIS